MYECLITFRSVMPAQRMEALLQRRGIGCTVRRTPKWMEVQGCGYSLLLPCSRVPEAVRLMGEKQIPYRKIYRKSAEGTLEEMAL